MKLQPFACENRLILFDVCVCAHENYADNFLAIQMENTITSNYVSMYFMRPWKHFHTTNRKVHFLYKTPFFNAWKRPSINEIITFKSFKIIILSSKMLSSFPSSIIGTFRFYVSIFTMQRKNEKRTTILRWLVKWTAGVVRGWATTCTLFSD